MSHWLIFSQGGLYRDIHASIEAYLSFVGEPDRTSCGKGSRRQGLRQVRPQNCFLLSIERKFFLLVDLAGLPH